MPFRSLCLSLSALSLLSACASIVSGSTQDVKLLTSPAASGSCTLTNSRGQWHAPNTPASVTVKRSTSDLTIACGDSYHGGSTTAKADIEAWTAGNILLGGVIGLAVDGITGAISSYDETITVPTGTGYSDPAAQMPVEPAAPLAVQPDPYAPVAPVAAPAAAPYVGGVPTQPGLLPLPPRNPHAVAPAAAPAAPSTLPVYQPQPVAAPVLTQPSRHNSPFYRGTSPYLKPSRY